MPVKLSFSVIIPTINRSKTLEKTLHTIALQSVQPQEIIIIDASENDSTKVMCNQVFPALLSEIYYQQAIVKGAASQRNQAIEVSSQPVICFMDDDVYLEPDCFAQLWAALNSSPNIGGANAMIVNQKYQKPGLISSAFYAFINGEKLSTYAGKSIGPGINFLPDDSDSLPEIVEVDWLNTTCTFYKKDALPTPVFESHFKGYSFMEDLTLSLTVAKKWKLVNVRKALVYHDTQPAPYKDNQRELSRMDLLNRYYLLTKVLDKNGLTDKFKLVLQQLFTISSGFASTTGRKDVLKIIAGKKDALKLLWK